MLCNGDAAESNIMREIHSLLYAGDVVGCDAGVGGGTRSLR